MSNWAPLTEYRQFLQDNPPKGSRWVRSEVWFPRSNPDICRASGYSDLTRAIISWVGLMLRQDPDAYQKPKPAEKLILALRRDGEIRERYAFMNAKGCHPDGEAFHASHYVYLGVPAAHFNLDQTAQNLLYGTIEMLKLYALPTKKIHIRRVG